ncbi:DegT/DnrJ/EryC1/StrS family aminotransferase [Kribbella sp. CA-293567]|uniref:DegT/DnrJ/EryC1/StrS family aminotransferase n=1 Tax=Kribbella sp. CA-293567 TaxID=3002436 RepID=UPI0022DCEE4D|nr:DegT/DnrJ/EryC1/StrS family aminotransferase [Kribbella sp. CA-293567]WBQ07618.1 DegT/DnrJ/EryC1/StrS family aminotransferase [Kribbella sp. CA-293567]
MPLSADSLALHGGIPLRQDPWPSWPRSDAETERLVLEVLRSGRWAISEMSNGLELFERRFAKAFAAYHEVPHCIPTTSGTSALTIAFEALGLSRGAEVLVPGMTWVACASAVAGAGLVPVLVDIDPQTLCMSPAAAEAAITKATEAVLLVHYTGNTADIGAFEKLSARYKLAVVEDCAQAHGAMYADRPVGSYGDIATFSMQDSKVLTSGEGGACLTRDAELADRMEQYRADGRRYSRGPVGLGAPDLEDRGDVQGRNLCLSEIQAAVLLGRLQRLDEENRHRQEMATVLDGLLAGFAGVSGLVPDPRMTRRTYYRYCLRLDPALFQPVEVEEIREELSAELQLTLEPLHDPLNDCTLYNPMGSPRKYDPALLPKLDPRNFDLPAARQARQQFLTLPHRVLLGDQEDMRCIATALEKVLSQRRSWSVPG